MGVFQVDFDLIKREIVKFSGSEKVPFDFINAKRI